MSTKNQAEQAASTETEGLTPVDVRRGPKMNGLKHGMRSDAILLPGDDAAEFHEAREDLLRTFQPLSKAEVRCVERIAGLEWRMARHARLEAVFDDKLETVLDDPGGAASQHDDPDPHRWQHRGDDCNKREGRLDRMLARTERRLFLLQKMRRNRLIAGADARHAAGGAGRLTGRERRPADSPAHPGRTVGRASMPFHAHPARLQAPMDVPPASPAPAAEPDNRWARRPPCLAGLESSLSSGADIPPATSSGAGVPPVETTGPVRQGSGPEEPDNRWVRPPSVPFRLPSSPFRGGGVPPAENPEPTREDGERVAGEAGGCFATRQDQRGNTKGDDRNDPSERRQPPPARPCPDVRPPPVPAGM